MKLTLKRKSELPLYRQIANQLREFIRTGILAPGSQLPTVRQLATEHQLTRLTVQTAYAELQAEGLIEAVVGRGSFVAAQPALPLSAKLTATSILTATPQVPWYNLGLLADMLRMGEQPALLSFAQSAPAPETFPVTELKRIMSSVINEPALLGYTSAQGDLMLREQVAHLLLDRGIVTPPSQVLITSGAHQALNLALQVFTKPDEVFLIEEPTYPGIIELAAQRKQPVIGIPRDAEGLSLQTLEQVCQLYRPKLLYLIPTFNNPTGSSLTEAHKHKLLRLASTYNLLIVEDDTYGFLPLTEQVSPLALRALDESGEQVIYLTSFSKVLMPALRLGALVAGKNSLEQLVAAKRSTDLNSSILLQRSLAEYLHRYSLGVHVQNARKLYRERYEVMAAALARHIGTTNSEWTRPDGGLSVWITLPPQVDEREFYLELINHGVGVVPGGAFFSQPQRYPHLRLSFGAQPVAQIEQGIAILGQVLRNHLARRTLIAAQSGRTANILV
jgi:DNA-binding transcriptional MocR family regulator